MANSLELHGHPLSSYSQKATVALYESGAAFTAVTVDLGDPASRGAFAALWPMAKMPVLRDQRRGHVVAESTAIIEYLDRFHPGPRPLLPADADQAWQARMWDRVFDNYVQTPMQKLVGDRLRPAGAGDAHGVAQAQADLAKVYDLLEALLPADGWFLSADFSLVDCSAAPALFYAHVAVPFGGDRPRLRAYRQRLMQRPSYARALREAEPYFQLVPLDRKPTLDLDA
jgi:glutathione S-transferase